MKTYLVTYTTETLMADGSPPEAYLFEDFNEDDAIEQLKEAEPDAIFLGIELEK